MCRGLCVQGLACTGACVCRGLCVYLLTNVCAACDWAQHRVWFYCLARGLMHGVACGHALWWNAGGAEPRAAGGTVAHRGAGGSRARRPGTLLCMHPRLVLWTGVVLRGGVQCVLGPRQLEHPCRIAVAKAAMCACLRCAECRPPCALNSRASCLASTPWKAPGEPCRWDALGVLPR